MKRDSLLSHCLARAAVSQGYDYGKSTSWAAIRATPMASRVAGFVCEWAVVRLEAGGPITFTEFLNGATINERTAYRRLAEFRELWPEYENPEPIARQLAERVGAEDLSRSGPLVQVAL